MPIDKKTPKNVTGRKTRRTPNVKLTAEELPSLIKLWNEYHGGTKAFAERMAEMENPGATVPPNTIAARVRALHRIEDQETGVSTTIFKSVADVLKITTAELKVRISASAPVPDKILSDKVGPWVTDENVLKEYRVVLHGYYITKQGDDYFWMYKPIDFTAPYGGCLHAVVNYGIKGDINYNVYAYLFRQMLVVITQSDEERNQRESVGLYHDFRRKIREHVGHFGLLLTEDWNGDIGLGGSMLLRKPLPGSVDNGRQSPAVCKRLTDYWKKLDGERCNRLLHLFGFGPYSRSASASGKKGKPTPASGQRSKKSARKK